MAETNGSILIPGGCGGLGYALLNHYRNTKHHCIVLDQNEESLKNLRTEFNEFEFIRCDLTDEKKLQTTFDEIFGKFKIIAVVNVVGWIHSQPLVKLNGADFISHSLSEWQKVLELNLTAPFLTTKLAAVQFLKRKTKAVIINVSSISAQGNPGQIAYSAAKAGLESFTSVAAKELGPLGIRCACIAPGFFDTPSTQAALSETQLNKIKSATPLRRLGAPEDFAMAVQWILENGFFNGKTLPLDGGYRL